MPPQTAQIAPALGPVHSLVLSRAHKLSSNPSAASLALAAFLRRCLFHVSFSQCSLAVAAPPSENASSLLICRVGQNHIYTPYMTVYLVISLSKIPYIHRIYMVMANSTHLPCVLLSHSYKSPGV